MSSSTMNVMIPFFGAPSPEDVFLETVRFEVPSLSTEALKVVNTYNNNDTHVSSNSIVVFRKKRERECLESKQSTERVVNNSLSSGGVIDESNNTCYNDKLEMETEQSQTRITSARNVCAVEYKNLMDLLEYAHFNHRTPWNLLFVRYATDLSRSSTVTDFSASTATGNISQNEDIEQTFTALSLYEQVEFARSALRHALSVIARLVHHDTLGVFTFAAATFESDELSKQHEIKEELQVVENTDMKETKVFSSTANCSIIDKEVRSLLTLYCKIQALELELNDLVLQVRDDHWESRSSGNHNKTSTNEKDDNLSATLCTIEECVNALETTIIDILLALPLHDTPITRNVNVNSSSSSSTISTNDNSLEINMSSPILTHIQQTHYAEFSYIVQLMLESLPDACEKLNWPCQLVHFGRSESKANNSSVTTNAYNKAIGENECYETKRQLMCNSATNAIMSIVLESTLQLKKSDCNSILQETTSQSKTLSPSPLLHRQHQEQTEQSISVLAALQLTRQNDTHNLLLWEEQLSVNELAAKAWRGAYSALGIRIAMLEMRLVFYKQYRILIDEILTVNANNMHKHKSSEANKSSIVATKHSKVSTTITNAVAHGTRGKQNIMWVMEKLTHLREQEMYWKRLLQTNYANFLNSVYHETDNAYCEWQHSELLSEDNIFDIIETSRTISSANALLSELQLICLRVVKRLREVDKNGWFAIPAFDLVNIDFTSVEMWIRRKSFARKSHRAAFEALRAVLEQMVDNCVAQYGPTHEFSLLITTVRQEFVSIARQEKLLETCVRKEIREYFEHI